MSHHLQKIMKYSNMEVCLRCARVNKCQVLALYILSEVYGVCFGVGINNYILLKVLSTHNVIKVGRLARQMIHVQSCGFNMKLKKIYIQCELKKKKETEIQS